MIKTVGYFVLAFSIISPLPSLWTGRKERGLLWFYSWACLLADVTGFVLLTLNRPRYWNSNLFLVAEFVLVARYLVINTSRGKVRQWLEVLVQLMALYFVIDTVRKSVQVLNYDDGALFYLLFILLLLRAFYQIIRDMEVLRIERSPFFIVCCGFLLYVAGSMIMLLFKKYLDGQNHQVMIQLWIVRNLLNILKNGAIAYALYLRSSHGRKK